MRVKQIVLKVLHFKLKIVHFYLQSCGDHIAQSIAHNFFHCALIGPIMQADEKASLTTTAILTKLLTMVRSKPLLREMIDFIIPPKENEENAKEQVFIEKVFV